jgi:UDP-glucose 4-epimerase
VATPAAIGEVVNIGNDEEISIEGLAQRVKQQAKSGSPIEFVPYDQAYEPGFEDMPRRVPCLDKLVKLTGFRPATPLTKIINRVIEHEAAKRSASKNGAPEELREIAARALAI